MLYADSNPAIVCSLSDSLHQAVFLIKYDFSTQERAVNMRIIYKFEALSTELALEEQPIDGESLLPNSRIISFFITASTAVLYYLESFKVLSGTTQFSTA